jgi:low temperature requirement protein LtrA
VKNQIDLGGHSERSRVERNPVLCGHLNGDVGIFVVLNFGEKIMCLVCSYRYTVEVHVYVLA